METPAIDPTVINELHDGDEARWAELFAQMKADADALAPRDLARALVTREPARGHWFARAREAAKANPDSSSIGQAREEAGAVLQWIDRGVAEAMAPSDLGALRWRVDMLAFADDLDGTLQLLAEFETHAAETSEHGMGLLLACRRLRESERHEEALEMASRASTMFEVLGELDWNRSARLEHAACLLLVQRLEEGLDILEEILPGPKERLILPRLGGVQMYVSARNPRLSAVAELVAATQGAFVFSRSATLTRALGGVAETFSDESLGETTHGPALWARFERWLDEVATEDIGGLETIIYQAQEREFHRVEEVARAAEEAARERPAKPRPTRDIFAFFGGPKKDG